MNGRAEIIDRGDCQEEGDEDHEETEHKQEPNLEVGEVVLGEVLEVVHKIFQHKLTREMRIGAQKRKQ